MVERRSLVQIGDIFLVDLLLLFRRRVRSRDIEMPVLHEIEIGVAAARLAPAGEFRVAFAKVSTPSLPWSRPSRRRSAQSSKSAGLLLHHCACARDGVSATKPAMARLQGDGARCNHKRFSGVDFQGVACVFPVTRIPRIVAIIGALVTPETARFPAGIVAFLCAVPVVSRQHLPEITRDIATGFRQDAQRSFPAANIGTAVHDDPVPISWRHRDGVAPRAFSWLCNLPRIHSRSISAS